MFGKISSIFFSNKLPLTATIPSCLIEPEMSEQVTSIRLFLLKETHKIRFDFVPVMFGKGDASKIELKKDFALF